MADCEPVNDADQLRSPQSALVPDPRSSSTSVFRQDGSFSPLTLDDCHDAIREFVLNESVPYDVRIHFETAKNLYLYAWFAYRFYPVAEQQALVSLEFGLRERLALSYPYKCGPASKWFPSLAKMLETARKDGLISNAGMRATERWALRRARDRVSYEAHRRLIESGAEFIEYDRDGAVPEPQDYCDDALTIFVETLPEIRNAYVHGSSMLHSSVIGTFEIVTDLMNQLFPGASK